MCIAFSKRQQPQLLQHHQLQLLQQLQQQQQYVHIDLRKIILEKKDIKDLNLGQNYIC